MRLAGVLAAIGIGLALAAGGLAGCGGARIGAGGVGPDLFDIREGLVGIDVAPDGVALAASDGMPGSATFTATGRYMDGHTLDLTTLVSWSVADPGLGVVTDGLLTTATSRGGRSAVVAALPGLSGLGHFTVKLSRARVSTDDGSTAPADSASKFQGTTSDSTVAPTLAYPIDGAMLPPNLGELEVQWRAPSSPADLYEVTFSSDTIDLRLYTNAVVGAGGRLALDPDDWAALAESAQGATVTLTVTGRSAADATHAGAAMPVQLQIGADEVAGGIYYWSASTGANGEGIQRHSFGDTSGMAKPFYTEYDGGKLLNANGQGTRCVACHVLSRDGTKFAITFDGGNGVADLLDVATRTPIIAPSPSLHWNFAALSPDGSRMIAAYQGVLTFYDAASGAAQGTLTVPNGWKGTHPDWSPDGKSIVFVGVPPASYGADWTFTAQSGQPGGSIFVATDDGMGGWPTRGLVMAAGNENDYYPSFSPDDQWVLFNRSHTNAYSVADAHLFVVAADGSKPPIALTAADGVGDLTNSWPRWSPFVQQHGPDGALFYFTFSSKRPYGIELPGGTPQVWMAAFSPRSGGEQGGGDPYSFAPFWLPFQDSTTSNHIAQWTQAIVGVQ